MKLKVVRKAFRYRNVSQKKDLNVEGSIFADIEVGLDIKTCKS